MSTYGIKSKMNIELPAKLPNNLVLFRIQKFATKLHIYNILHSYNKISDIILSLHKCTYPTQRQQIRNYICRIEYYSHRISAIFHRMVKIPVYSHT